jgi:hypothetical protein
MYIISRFIGRKNPTRMTSTKLTEIWVSTAPNLHQPDSDTVKTRLSSKVAPANEWASHSGVRSHPPLARQLRCWTVYRLILPAPRDQPLPMASARVGNVEIPFENTEILSSCPPTMVTLGEWCIFACVEVVMDGDQDMPCWSLWSLSCSFLFM